MTMRPHLGIVLFVLLGSLFGSIRTSHAGGDAYRFDTWTTDDGLPQNSVYAITQTRDGYLWFTTLDGVVRYNGAQFTVFNKVNTKGINSNRFRCMYEDREGTLWLGSEEGGLTRYRDGTFTSYTSDDGLPHNVVLRIREDDDRSLLVSTQAGLARIRNGRIETASLDVVSIDADIGHRGPSGTTWYRAHSELRRARNGQVTGYAVPPGGRGRHLFNQVFEDRQGRLWIGTWTGGEVAVLENESLSFFSQKDGLPSAPIVTFCQTRDGSVWLGSAGGGLARFRNGRFTTYTTEHGLASDTIETILEDREGTIWVGTFDNGITRITPRIITTYSEKDGMVGRIFYPIIEDRSGTTWIGNRGVNRFSGGRFTYDPLNISPGHISAGVRDAIVQAFFEDSQGRLWIGHDWGLFTYKDGRFKFEDQKPTRGWPHAIHIDSRGYLWVGYTQRLIRHKDGQEKQFTIEDGLEGLVQPIFEDSRGHLWVGSYGGLARVIDDRLAFYTESDGLSSNRVRAIHEDADGVLWIGTYDGGLNRFKDGKFTRYTTVEGMYSNGVFAILEDDRGNFWMSSNQGIHRVSRRQLNDFAEGKISRIDSVSYGKADGMLNTECNGARHPSAIRSRDGRFWFPTFEGVAVVDPEAVSLNPVPPPVVIEQVRIDREPQDAKRVVEIRPGKSNLEIRYAALSFIKPEHVNFKYRLEGLDRDWNEVGNRRVAYYTHVPPGAYTFRVVAANSDGVWNLEGASIGVRVYPPFWRTWWSIGIAAALIVGLALLAHRRRIAVLRKRQIEQQTFLRKLIDSQEAERKRIATELHDSLGQSLVVIKNSALLSLNAPESPEMALSQMSEISSTASQAIGEVKEIAYNLRPYQLDRLGITKAIEAMVSKMGASSGIEFSYHLDRIDGLFSKDDEINIYRIIQESVSNTVKHSGATRGRVDVKLDGEAATIVIEDNGKGFIRNNDNRPHGQGLGLVGISERARLLGAKHEIVSAPGRGTKVTISVPVAGRYIDG